MTARRALAAAALALMVGAVPAVATAVPLVPPTLAPVAPPTPALSTLERFALGDAAQAGARFTASSLDLCPGMEHVAVWLEAAKRPGVFVNSLTMGPVTKDGAWRVDSDVPAGLAPGAYVVRAVCGWAVPATAKSYVPKTLMVTRAKAPAVTAKPATRATAKPAAKSAKHTTVKSKVKTRPGRKKPGRK